MKCSVALQHKCVTLAAFLAVAIPKETFFFETYGLTSRRKKSNCLYKMPKWNSVFVGDSITKLENSKLQVWWMTVAIRKGWNSFWHCFDLKKRTCLDELCKLSHNILFFRAKARILTSGRRRAAGNSKKTMFFIHFSFNSKYYENSLKILFGIKYLNIILTTIQELRCHPLTSIGGHTDKQTHRRIKPW